MNKQRIDVLLVERGLVESRTKAQALLLAGDVVVDDHRVDKAGTKVATDAVIRIKGNQEFVSRGGYKISAALDAWPSKVADSVCLDVGASTGGFTDVLLKRGAALVYAVDVGHSQLHWSLRTNPKVRNLEKTHITKIEDGFFDPLPTLVVIDVSFISLSLVLPAVQRHIERGARVYALIKPQFEVGRELLEKGGIVKNDAARQAAVEKIMCLAQSLGFKLVGQMPSPITGTDGNIEYLCALDF